MDFKTFFFSIPVAERANFARRCKTTAGHLRNVAYGKPCSAELAIEIDRESGGNVAAESMCPIADWHYIRGSAASAAACR